MNSLYLDSSYPQPVDGGSGPSFDQIHEYVDYLPNTNLRIWYSSFNRFYSDHWHDAMEIIYCKSGYYVMAAEGKTWELHKGDLLLMPGGITHSLDLHEDCHGFVYLISLEFLEHMPSAAAILPFISHPVYFQKSSSAPYQTIAALLEQMKNEYFSGNDLRELMIYSHMLVLLTEISRSYLIKPQKLIHIKVDKQKEYQKKFNEILTYINEHFSEDLTLEIIAKQFGFSKYYFSRLFSHYSSYHFCDYLTNRRIKAAEVLLGKSTMSITEIANHVGFNSLSTFSRVFKHKNCNSPSDYRRLYDCNPSECR